VPVRYSSRFASYARSDLPVVPLYAFKEAVTFEQHRLRRARVDFSRLKHVLDLPNLIDIQRPLRVVPE